ncbi:hypothetical protein [Plantactinospora soyae]|uniref:Uncharacterized protein n=1 Tax=Plantactinospora soyae TaxID=1544732 RepID=A0A927QYD4_9ACTN|nr:hypothetical protein [Plantactinospora soyae]MBE1486418.1 hypothetical protein [Plantactinospora soyae]
MGMIEGPHGVAIDAAYDIITTHASGGDCGACRLNWCPTAEWALWVVVAEPAAVRPDARQLVTIVARQVMAAHWPSAVDGCRPCGLPDCDRIRTAGPWLEVHDPGYVPPLIQTLTRSRPPTDDELREITGID